MNDPIILMRGMNWPYWLAPPALVFSVFLIFRIRRRKPATAITAPPETESLQRQLEEERNARRILEERLAMLSHEMGLEVHNVSQSIESLREGLERIKEERRRAEETLRHGEAQKQALLNAFSDHLVFTDLEGRVVWGNQSLADRLSLPVSTLAGRKCHPLCEDMGREPCATCIKEEAAAKRSTVRRIMNGRDGRVFSVTAEPVFDDMGALVGVLEMSADITDQLQREERRHETRKLQAIAELAGGIAHKFNNDLFAISGTVELLQSLMPASPLMDRYVRIILDTIGRMSRLTEQLLAYARGGKYRSGSLSLNTLITAELAGREHDIPETVSLTLGLEEDLHDITADAVQLRMVVSAIISNALEAITGPGWLHIATANHHHQGAVDLPPEMAEGFYVRLSVTDSGQGMDETVLSRIFEPFFSTRFLGRGLGLPASHGIIRNHGGWIDVRSQPGQGTTVTVYLPAAPSSSPADQDDAGRR